ncbi:MAG: hypothetical protein ACR2NR_21880, partial [Solirubrobacteraceae bacterium]
AGWDPVWGEREMQAFGPPGGAPQRRAPRLKSGDWSATRAVPPMLEAGQFDRAIEGLNDLDE